MSYNILRIVALTSSITLGAMVNSAHAETSAGTFVGASNHVTSGSVSVEHHADGSATITLGKDFFFDGAPDPWVSFGRNGKYSQGTNIKKLKSKTGAQVYKVPARVKASKYDRVYIWCERFSVPLGYASLK